MRSLAAIAALMLTLVAATPALADSPARPLPPCTVKTPSGTPCTPFFGGALRIGDPAVSDTLRGGGQVTNYSLAGDGTVWNINFAYSPGYPISDRAVGFLVYDAQWNVVALQNATGNPPHSVTFPLVTNNGTTYQVQVFNYAPATITYTVGVTQGS